MRVYIEDAVIVEVYETEPNFPVETVRPEVISDKKKKRRGFMSLFDFLSDPFESLFGEESLFGSLFDLNSDPSNELESEPEENEEEEKAELAVITETHERKIREYTFFYYEVVS